VASLPLLRHSVLGEQNQREDRPKVKLTLGKLARLLVAVAVVAGAATLASAQSENSGPQSIALNGTLPESLTLSLSSNAVTFALTAGSATNAGNTGVTATTAWVLKPGRTAVKLYAYFNSAAAALTDGTNNIPSSSFKIADNGGASAALNNTVIFGAANAGLQLANVAITAANRIGNRADAMAFNIDLSTLPQLPASVYLGTLNIQAQATP
jgi:hypothetical protein